MHKIVFLFHYKKRRKHFLWQIFNLIAKNILLSFNTIMNIIEKSLATLEYDKILEKLANFAKCEQSRNICLNLMPQIEISKIQEELNFTNEAKQVLDLAVDIPLEFVANITSIKKHTSSRYLSEEEIVDVAKMLRSSRLVKKFLAESLGERSILRLLSSHLYVNRDLEDKIEEIFDENYNIKPDATIELRTLHASLRDNEDNLKKAVNNLLNTPEFSKHLQDSIYTTRDDRIVFQVMASSKSKVPGIVHDVSATNKTFYIEPSQIVPLNNKIRECKSKINAEMIKILVNLTDAIKSNINDLAITEEILARIDFHFAKARYGIHIKGIMPEIVYSKFLKIENMKHPLLVDCIENVVANDFEIGKEFQSVIITGSNTGGKTVTLKTVGLFILMTRAGLFIPCTMAKIHPFDKVLADIGDDQSILQSLSTFSSHMTNIIDILKISDNNTFVVIDEICAGTDPQEGAVLAECILARLAEKNVVSTITTHYGELKALEFNNSYFKNASVEFDTNSLKPTYKLTIGIPGLSNAISISQNLGLDKELCEQARNILISQKDPSILVVEKLQETQQKLAQNLEEAESLKIESQNLKDEYEDNLSKIKKDKKRAIKSIKDKFEHEILAAKSEIKDILDEMRQAKSEKIARRSYARLAEAEHIFKQKLSEFEDKEKYAPVDWDSVKPKDKLLLKDLNQLVTVLSTPDRNNNVYILMGNFKTKIKSEKLAGYDETFENFRSNITTTIPVASQFNLKKRDISPSLDLRGIRVEEALDSLETYLDKASLVNLTPVTVIHGHGTGAMKSAVREFLSTSPYVKEFRPGYDGEGGDGVSVVEIK